MLSDRARAAVASCGREWRWWELFGDSPLSPPRPLMPYRFRGFGVRSPLILCPAYACRSEPYGLPVWLFKLLYTVVLSVSLWRRSPPRRDLLRYRSFFFVLFCTLTLDSLLLSLLAPARCCHAGLVGVVLSFFSSLALHPFSFVSLGWWLDTTQSRIVILTVLRSSESSLAASLVRMRCIPKQQPAECGSSEDQ